MVFERRYAEGEYGRLSTLATELARLNNVDIIVTASTPPARAAKSVTTSIPIVILDPGDPVGSGLVMSLARPGGNVTGVASIAPDLAAKRLQLLKEAAPQVSRVAVLFNAAIPPAEVALRELQATAQTLGVQIRPVGVARPSGFAVPLQVRTRRRAVVGRSLTLAVGRGRASLDGGYDNEVAARVGVKENPPVADSSAKGGWLILEMLDVSLKGIVAHRCEHR